LRVLHSGLTPICQFYGVQLLKIRILFGPLFYGRPWQLNTVLAATPFFTFSFFFFRVFIPIAPTLVFVSVRGKRTGKPPSYSRAGKYQNKTVKKTGKLTATLLDFVRISGLLLPKFVERIVLKTDFLMATPNRLGRIRPSSIFYCQLRYFPTVETTFGCPAEKKLVTAMPPECSRTVWRLAQWRISEH
jgi:hypothetical protein